MKRTGLYILPLAAMMLACGEDTPVDTAENINNGVELNSNDPYADYTTTASGLRYKITSPGAGPKLNGDDVIKVHYRGMFTDSSKFDASYDRGVPLWVAIGKGMVIPGWDEGLSLLSLGDKASFYIPSHIGYGPNGMGQLIPPNADLLFEVEIMEVVGPYRLTDEQFEEKEEGLKIGMWEAGTGQQVKEGDVVDVHYVVYLPDGSLLDASHMKMQPYRFKVGEGQVVRGWDLAMPHLKVGDKARLSIPSNIGYGDEPGGRIAPGTTLTFDVEIMGVVQ